MKREELKAKLVEAGVADDKMSAVLDYIMAQNGAEINSLKEENKALKSTNDEANKSKDDEIKSLKAQIESYSDYDDLKKFKEDTIATAENDKRVNYLKAQGCKHPDLVMGKLDFSKATYDEDKKTYTGLENSIKELKGTYQDLFEEKGTQHPNSSENPNPTGSSFFEEYKKNNPNLFK